MKTLLLFLIMIVVGTVSTTASARLFKSASDCYRCYGKPTKIKDDYHDYRSMGFMIIVHIWKDKVNAISYQKTSNKLSKLDIKLILMLNAPKGTVFVKLPKGFKLAQKNIHYVLCDEETLKHDTRNGGSFVSIEKYKMMIMTGNAKNSGINNNFPNKI